MNCEMVGHNWDLTMTLSSPPKWRCVRCGVFVTAEERGRLAQRSEVADPVNHPAHYKQGGIETIDVIEAWQLGFHLGNCVKYLSRAGKKDPAKTVEDLQKARFYLDREIERLTKGAA